MEDRARTGAAVGVAAAAAVLGYAAVDQWRRRVEHRSQLGGLRGEQRTVVTPDGVRLHVEIEAGAPGRDGPVLVFVHGLSMSQDSWHYQRSYFRSRRVPMVFVDQRSHGRSTASPEDTLTISQLGEDLAQVLDEVVGDRPVVLLGHSMGGMTLMALAEARPELFRSRVRGVVFVGTSAGDMATNTVVLPFLPAAVGERVSGPAVRGLRRASGLIDAVRDHLPAASFAGARVVAFGRSATAEQMALVARDTSVLSSRVIFDLASEFDAHHRYDALEVVDDVPSLIVSGTWDVVIRHRHALDLHERLPRSTLLELPGVGHCPMIEQPRVVNAAIERFVAGLA